MYFIHMYNMHKGVCYCTYCTNRDRLYGYVHFVHSITQPPPLAHRFTVVQSYCSFSLSQPPRTAFLEQTPKPTHHHTPYFRPLSAILNRFMSNPLHED